MLAPLVVLARVTVWALVYVPPATLKVGAETVPVDAVKLAFNDVSRVIIIVQVVLVPEHAPDQPLNV